MTFKALPKSTLRKMGWVPKWIVDYSEEGGPFRPVKVRGRCSCCDRETFKWTVVSLRDGLGEATEWGGEEAELQATKHARALNYVWLNVFECASIF